MMHIAQRLTVLAAVLAVLICAVVTFAHGGGLDANGGHNDRKNGGYHFHRGPLAGQSFADKSSALAALRDYEQKQQKQNAPAAEKPAVEKPVSVDDKVEALKRCLIAKGIISEADFKTQLAQVIAQKGP